jgi:PWWP domain
VISRTPTVLPNTNITLETPRFDQKIPDSFRHYRGQGSHSENSDASDFSDSCTTCDDFSESYTNSEYGSSGEEASDSEIVSGNNSDSGSYPPGRNDEDSRTTSTSDKKEEDKRSESRQSNESAEIERPTAKSSSGLRPLQLVWAKSRGYPWYPALIIDPDIPKGFVHNSVPLPCPPQHVLDLRKHKTNADFLVLFFDAKRTWQWLPSGKLELLGINKSIDESKLIESRKPADRKAVKKAYEEALHYQSQVTKKRPEGKL